jgi:DNA invertase Pin-like site-specific DNA recombinase
MSKTTTKPTRAAIYARVSTSDQDTGMQVAELRQVCEQRGWCIVAQHLDDGVSGAATSRAGLDALVADVHAGRVDVVVVWKLDRLGRSLGHVLGLLDAFTAAGVQFVSVRDPGIDTTSITGRLLTQVLACFASYERDMIRMRVQAGVNRGFGEGVWRCVIR